MKRQTTVLISSLCLALGSATFAQVTTDLWDSHQGATIVNSSGEGPQPLVDMFGGVSPGPEPGGALFPDIFPIGYTQFVEWQTAAPISLLGYHILANDDDGGIIGGRGFTAFRLYAFNAGTGHFELLDTFRPVSNPYPNFYQDITRGFSAVTAQLFRAEFDQATILGPRVFELDSITEANPLLWTVGLNDNGWPAGDGGGPNATFVAENGSINNLPGSPVSPEIDRQADNDYYFAGVYTTAVDSVINSYGDYTPVGVVPVNEEAAERAFASADNDLRYHFNLPSSLLGSDRLSVTFDVYNLDDFPADSVDPRYGVEVYFNGVLVQPQILARPTDYDRAQTTPSFSLASVNAQVGPGFDNIVSLRGINYNDNGGGNWMGLDYVQLNSVPLPVVNVPGNLAVGPPAASAGGSLQGEYWKRPPVSIPTDGAGNPADRIDTVIAGFGPPDATFRAAEFVYLGNDLTPVTDWLASDAGSFVGAANNLDDGAVRFRGYINVAAASLMRLGTTSDDGSRMTIAGIDIINNDGSHGENTVDAMVNFAAPGLYPIEIAYFNGDWTSDGSDNHSGNPDPSVHGGASFHLRVAGDDVTAATAAMFHATLPALDFNDCLVPPGTFVGGFAKVADDGAGNCAVHLTDANQCSGFGSFVIPDQAAGNDLRQIHVHWRSLVGGDDGFVCNATEFGRPGADGYSFNWGTDLAPFGAGEEGTGSGLSVTIDTWDNGDGEAPGLEIKWRGARVAFDGINPDPGLAKDFLRKNQFVEADVQVDAAGHATFTYDGRVLTATLGGWTGLAGGFFVFGARTGAASDNHWIDDVLIEAEVQTNHCPTASPLSVAVSQGSEVHFQLLGADPDGDAIQFKISESPARGVLTLEPQTGAAIYTPMPGSCGPDSFKYTVNDGQCVSPEAIVTIKVNDTTPPVIKNFSSDTSKLWPPDHSLRDVTLNYTADDSCGGPVTSRLTVKSNQPENGTGDGDTAPDWIVVDAHHLRLRAERAGNGSDRVYTITITCVDEAGNSSTRSAEVVVPHSNSAPSPH